MSFDAWSSEGRALPRPEELPVAEQGYEREAVRQAFDAFYRHIAQLDSTLKTLEAVEVFQRQAGELRTELRALRASAWTQQPWTSYAALPADRRLRPLVSPALPRIAAEVAFIVAVAVVAGVGHFSAALIVVMMAAAWAIVGAVEWFAGRERIPAPAVAPEPAVIEGTLEPPRDAPAPAAAPEPVPAQSAEYGWSAFSERAEPTGGADAMTIAGGMPGSDERAPEAPEPEPASAEQAPEPEPVATDESAEQRRGWFRRRRDTPPGEPEEVALSSNVRVLPADEREERRWEADLDAAVAAAAEEAGEPERESDESTDENAVGPLRRFRRR